MTVTSPNSPHIALTYTKIGLAMRLRIHAVHADDPHMRICASRCACKNLDAHQPHTGAKYTTFPHLIPPSIYGVMYVLELDLAVESASHQYE